MSDMGVYQDLPYESRFIKGFTTKSQCDLAHRQGPSMGVIFGYENVLVLGMDVD